jgi:lipoate-protein ligase A
MRRYDSTVFGKFFSTLSLTPSKILSNIRRRLSLYRENSALKTIDSGIQDATVNMSLDASYLENLSKEEKPLLHFYDWSAPSATYGHFIDPKKHLRMEIAGKRGLTLARRSTGGGIVFHIWDLAFSFLLPAKHPAFSANALENYQFVNEIALLSMQSAGLLDSKSAYLIPESMAPRGHNCTHFCMARPTVYDVVYEGKKLIGAAQRKTKAGYLHQGTLSLAVPDWPFLRELLLSEEEIAQAMEMYTFAPLGEKVSPAHLREAKERLKVSLEQNFIAKLETFIVN